MKFTRRKSAGKSISAWLIPLAGVGFAIAFAKKRALTACFAGILAGLLPKTIRAKFTVSEIPVLNAIRVHKNKRK